MNITKEKIEELYERSKNDNEIFVGSEIRELIGEIRWLNREVEKLEEQNFEFRLAKMTPCD